MAADQAPDVLSGTVLGTIIDYDNFEAGIALGEDAFEGSSNCPQSVIGGDDNGDKRCVAHECLKVFQLDECEVVHALSDSLEL